MSAGSIRAIETITGETKEIVDLANRLAAEKNYALSSQILKNAILENKAPCFYPLAASTLLECGKLEDAEEICMEGMAFGVTDPALWITYARISEARNELAVAASRWRLLRHNFPDEKARYIHGMENAFAKKKTGKRAYTFWKTE